MESKPTPSILTSNPFEIFTTSYARYHLFRQIIDANSPLSDESENRVLATLKFHQELMDDLSTKESRQLLALSCNVMAEPWPLPGPKASGEELDGEALRASLNLLEESSQPLVTSTPILLEGTTSVPVSQLPFFSVDIPRSRSSHIPLVSALTASLMSASMCFSDSICVTPLPVEYSVSLPASSYVCISETGQVCAPVSLPVSVPYLPSLFVSQSVPDLSVSKFSEFHIRDVNQFVGQQSALVSGSGLSIPVSVSAPGVSVCGVSFSAVVMHRQMASSIKASLALLRTSIAAQQDVAASLERTLLDHYREIARLETRHAAILATQAHTAVSTGTTNHHKSTRNGDDDFNMDGGGIISCCIGDDDNEDNVGMNFWLGEDVISTFFDSLMNDNVFFPAAQNN
nr:transcription repressor MYB5-like [Ipomoea batatas]